MTVKTHSQMFR